MKTPGRLWIVILSEELSRRIAKFVSSWNGADKRILSDQLMRASYSVGANLVEGYARLYPRDSIRFYSTAIASAEEVLYWIHTARDRAALSSNDAANLCAMYIRLIRGIDRFIEVTRKDCR